MRNPYQRIKYIHFWGFPQYIDFSRIISGKIARISFNPPRFKNAIGGIYCFFKISIYRRWEYKEKKSEKGRFLLFYGEMNCRLDHQRTFLTFADKFKDADVVYGDFVEKCRIDIIRFFKSIPLFFIWLFQMVFGGVPFYASLNVIYNILMCYYQKKDLPYIYKRKYGFIVVYYDVSPDECYLVQEFKHRGCLTMTLQHGIFSRKSTLKTLSDTAFELSESISDYYLAWNQYTKDEAVKVGVSKEKIVVLGAPKYIDLKEPEKSIFAENETFGIILNNSSFDVHNRRLIEMANRLSNEIGYKYVVRYHPELSGKEYDCLFEEGFLKKDDNKQTIAEYASKVSFSIISSSSVFVDLLLLKHPVYRLKIFKDDTYSSVEYNSFKSVDELKSLLEKRETGKEAFYYLCNSYNVYQNYREFFDKMLLSPKNV